MSIIKMYTAAAAGALVTSSIDIPAKGIIRALSMGLMLSDGASSTGEQAVAELSFLSAPGYTSNDQRGSLCQVGMAVFFAAAGVPVLQGHPFCILTPIAIKVEGGERIFLHLTPQGSQSASVVSYLFIDDGIDVGRAQVRRR